MDEILDTRSQIATTSPNVFNESDSFRIDLEFFSKPAIVELDTFIFEEMVFVRFVENLDPHHHERRVMTSC